MKNLVLIFVLLFGWVLPASALEAAINSPSVTHTPIPQNKVVPELPSKKLHIRSIHTGETLEITFWKDGAYIPDALSRMNNLLRDHRSGDITTMDPELFILIHRLYDDLDATGPIEIISGHRSRKTNNMLREKGRKVAKRSQHILGKAMDIRIKSVSLKRLRDKVLSYGVGGVGYYPNSNFVHVDTGRPRFW